MTSARCLACVKGCRGAAAAGAAQRGAPSGLGPPGHPQVSPAFLANVYNLTTGFVDVFNYVRTNQVSQLAYRSLEDT